MASPHPARKPPDRRSVSHAPLPRPSPSVRKTTRFCSYVSFNGSCVFVSYYKKSGEKIEPLAASAPFISKAFHGRSSPLDSSRSESANPDPQSSQVVQKRAETASTRYTDKLRALPPTIPADMPSTSLRLTPTVVIHGEFHARLSDDGQARGSIFPFDFFFFSRHRHSDPPL